MLLRLRTPSALWRAAPHATPTRCAIRTLSTRGQRHGADRQHQKKKKPQLTFKDVVLRVPELCTAERFAQELRMSTPKLQELAEELGEHIDAPSRPLTAEVMELLAMEVGATLQITPVDVSRRPSPSEKERASLPVRPPVVTLMGHVDHGKTSLLDAFRNSDIASGEAGGITQGISAFIVDEGTEQAMTFIDTPGHELFAAMRQRGARATDIIILVVAVDAGVQPTTEQAIEFARQMGTPLVVAINKMDRPDAQKLLPKITQQLLARGVVPEDMGGEVPLVGVSATKRLHLDRLREAVLLQAELLELRAESQGPAEGVVLEATVQKGLGVVANVLVQRGALKPSDLVVVGTTWGKIKTLTPTDGTRRLDEAGPSTPVRISGLRELPRTGDELLVVGTEAKAKQDRVKLKVIRADVGAVTEADVQLAEATSSAIIGFNVGIPSKVSSLAEELGVPVLRHAIIYELSDRVKELLENAIEPVLEEIVLGAAQVQQLFTLTLNRKDRRSGMLKQTQVAGLLVSEGEASAVARVRVERGAGNVLHEGRVVSLKHFKNEVKTVRRGLECGIVLANYSGCEPGDILTFYDIVPRKPSLYEAAAGSTSSGSGGKPKEDG
ncbi:translation initiation factor if-2 [Chrysochromulina tobinii]|uniref:Translation initiation factor IF-2, mitochondrial n=1 Tax=Chrysochromulina tobinii TaxID=1460289 RepID=A0A0M0LPU3_9EUKA|nr:translation initiation factor if-2 [Chrysochromulina tobinii]|eukprot:KOO53049.1 translation initiation factor if-2 [Chrysochromulina sp. CCMP291]